MEGALGTYYLYFADHKGSQIKLAYAVAGESWLAIARLNVQVTDAG